LAAVVAAGGLVLAACGSDDTTASAPAASDSPSASATPSSSATEMMAAFGPACASVPADGEGSFAGMADDPAATAASNNPVLSTLVTAVTEAGLVDTLNGDGPFTIFAPTNDAFAALPEEQLDAVLADKDLLTSVLTYHVVAGEKLDADGLAGAKAAPTVEGDEVMFGTDGTTVNGADVVCSNVATANATVHIIDEVLLPPTAMEALGGGAMSGEGSGAMGATMEPSGPACASVPADGEGSFAGMADDPAATAASNNPVLSTLVTAVTKAGLVDTLNGEGPFTIFAPTNDAFAALPEEQLDAVLADTGLLTDVLTYHVVAGDKLSAADLVTAGTVDTVNGERLTIGGTADAVTVDGADVVCMNVPTANATVHIIDTVLKPG